MTWSDHIADLDATAFEHLADDAAATLVRGGVVLAALPMMLDRVTRPSVHQGIATLESADVVRFSVAALEAQAPSLVPMSGDVVTVAAVPYAIHGSPWPDEEMNGRDWLCSVVR